MDSDLNMSNGQNNNLVLVITPSIATSDIICEYLTDRKYSIGGPFKSVDSGYMYVRKYKVDAIIFDLNTSHSEITSMIDLLKQDVKGVPLILLSNAEIPFEYENSHTLSLPIKANEISSLLIKLLKGDKDSISDNERLIEFINIILSKIIELTPDNFKQSVTSSLKEGALRFSHRNSPAIKRCKDELSFIITDELYFDYKNISSYFHYTMDEVVEEINAKENITWTKSLFLDSIENLLLKVEMNIEILYLVKEMGIDVEKFGNSVAAIIPHITEMDKDAVVFVISLTDIGPELTFKLGDEEILDFIDERVASQILTLVGQGSEYHEGIFGPIPIPSPMDLTALICSKKMTSPIRDERMRGKSLNVIAIAFRRQIMSYLPDRGKIPEIFMEYREISNVIDLNVTLLQNIREKFINYLDC